MILERNIIDLKIGDTVNKSEVNSIARKGHLIYLDGVYKNWNDIKLLKGMFSVVSIIDRSALVKNLHISSNSIFNH